MESEFGLTIGFDRAIFDAVIVSFHSASLYPLILIKLTVIITCPSHRAKNFEFCPTLFYAPFFLIHVAAHRVPHGVCIITTMLCL